MSDQLLSTPRCGARRCADGAVAFRVWAPAAEKVELLLSGKGGNRSLPMDRDEWGYYDCKAEQVDSQARYSFRLNGDAERPDPCSLWQPEGVHKPSALYFPETFDWTASFKGLPRSELVFYEVHVGTFSRAGTFAGITEKLEDLKALGITALEIMPVSQFPGERNWGYDGVYPYATQHSYGGPRGLQELIDAAHRAGLAVFLDVVYNHMGPEGNYLREFGPYFTDAYKTPWGAAINFDGPGSDGVRDFVLHNVNMWLADFRFDGLRLDAVHAIFDLGAQHILADIKLVADRVAAEQGREIQIIAESDMNDPRLIRSVERGGYGLDGQWSDDFHHIVHSLMTGETQGYYSDFGRPEQLAQVLNDPFVYAGQHSRHRRRRHGAPATDLPGDQFVVAIQNHDQVGNRAEGDRFSSLISEEKQRLAASILLLSPHLPFLFMGEEYGEKNPFPFFCSFGDEGLVEAVRKGRREEFAAFAWQGEVPDPQSPATFESARLTWEWPEGTHHAGLRRLYQDLLRVRRTWPAMKDFTNRTAEYITSENRSLVRLVRGKGDEQLEIFINLQDRSYPLPMKPGGQLLFSSEAARYQGARQADARANEILAHEALVFGPAKHERLFEA